MDPSLDPSMTLKVLVIFQFLMNLAIAVLTIWKLFQRMPPIHEIYATKIESANYRNEVEKRMDRIESAIERMAETAEGRTQALHERINLILATVSRIEGSCRAQCER